MDFHIKRDTTRVYDVVSVSACCPGMIAFTHRDGCSQILP
jgi:hypothetical protein